jgi:hypothetical protein
MLSTALPSWVLEASRLVTGSIGWPAYLVSQLFVAAAYVFVFLLGRDMMGPERAAALIALSAAAVAARRSMNRGTCPPPWLPGGRTVPRGPTSPGLVLRRS